MAIALVATIAVVALTRVRLGLSAAPALLLLGPSTLYFSLMRFDILCALVLCLSLAAFARGRYLLAHVLLGVATLVKWYPAVVFPVYLAFHLSQEPALARHALHLLRTQAARYAAAYVLTVAAIVALTIAAVTWDGFMMPYRFHGERGGQYFNPYWLVEQMRPALGLDQSGWNWVNRVFLALQVSILPMLLFTRVRSLTQVVQYSVLAIYLFVTFGRVDSPQWILWTVPPVLMFARDARTLIAVAVLTVCNYLVFPVAYDALDPTGVAFSAIVFVKDLILLALIVLAFRDRGPEVRPPTTAFAFP